MPWSGSPGGRSILADWAFTQGQHITHTQIPSVFYQQIQKHNLRGVSDKITQDCLLLAGQKDRYIPRAQFEKLCVSLPHARTVTSRMFAQDEGGEQHCQIGNHKVAMREIVQWLKRLESGNGHETGR